MDVLYNDLLRIEKAIKSDTHIATCYRLVRECIFRMLDYNMPKIQTDHYTADLNIVSLYLRDNDRVEALKMLTSVIESTFV